MSADHRPDAGLLAEYAEGLLDGTPEGRAVEARLAADPAWAAAYAELSGALAAVRADLAALGPVGPLPAAVADRIDAALAAHGAGVAADLGAAGARPLGTRRRTLALTALAASVAAVVGAAVLAGLHTGGSVVPAEALPDRVGTAVVTSTGVDHATASVPGTGSSVATDGPLGVAEARTAPSAPGSAPVPAALSRLTAPAALAACLAAIRRLVGDAAPPTRSVDFARFGGVPALVVTLADGPSGLPQVLVVGPDCGAGGADLISRTDGTP